MRPAKPKSPWEQYEKVYRLLHLEGKVWRAACGDQLVNLRKVTSSNADRTLYLYHHLDHRNIATMIEAFSTSKGLYIVQEQMQVTLHHLVQFHVETRKDQLIAILGQVGNISAILLATLMKAALRCHHFSAGSGAQAQSRQHQL